MLLLKKYWIRFKQFIRKHWRKITKSKPSKRITFVKAWLDFNNISYIPHYKVSVPKKIDSDKPYYINFMATVNKKQYAIVCYDKCHYEFIPFLHRSHLDFEKQIRRDEYMESWCRNNGIVFMELPYYYTYHELMNQLEKLI